MPVAATNPVGKLGCSPSTGSRAPGSSPRSTALGPLPDVPPSSPWTPLPRPSLLQPISEIAASKDDRATREGDLTRQLFHCLGVRANLVQRPCPLPIFRPAGARERGLAFGVCSASEIAAT